MDTAETLYDEDEASIAYRRLTWVPPLPSVPAWPGPLTAEGEAIQWLEEAERLVPGSFQEGPSENLIDALVSRVSWLESRVGELLAAARPAPEAALVGVAPGTAAAWRLAHGDQVAAHEGQFIAIHGTEGIVAASTDLGRVIQEVRAKDLAGDVVIQAVRTRLVAP